MKSAPVSIKKTTAKKSVKKVEEKNNLKDVTMSSPIKKGNAGVTLNIASSPLLGSREKKHNQDDIMTSPVSKMPMIVSGLGNISRNIAFIPSPLKSKSTIIEGFSMTVEQINASPELLTEAFLKPPFDSPETMTAGDCRSLIQMASAKVLPACVSLALRLLGSCVASLELSSRNGNIISELVSQWVSIFSSSEFYSCMEKNTIVEIENHVDATVVKNALRLLVHLLEASHITADSSFISSTSNLTIDLKIYILQHLMGPLLTVLAEADRHMCGYAAALMVFILPVCTDENTRARCVLLLKSTIELGTKRPELQNCVGYCQKAIAAVDTVLE